MKSCPERYDAAVHAAMVLHHADRVGVPRAEVFAAAGFPPDIALDDFARAVPFEQVAAGLRLLQERTNDPCVGLHMGQRAPVTLLGLVGYLLVNLPSLRAQIEMSYAHCERLSNLFKLELALDQEPARLALRPVEPVPPMADQIFDFHLAMSVSNVRLYISPSFRPLRATFPHPAPADAGEYARHFDCPLEFDAPCAALEFEQHWLDTAPNGADPRLQAVLQPYVEEKLRQVPDRHAATARVRSVLVRRLGSAAMTLAAVAAELGYAPRTLQQRLAEEGVTFQQVLDEVRMRVAGEALHGSGEPVDALGARLGYADAASFIRAFRRWTGTTPQAYRRGGVRPDAR